MNESAEASCDLRTQPPSRHSGLYSEISVAVSCPGCFAVLMLRWNRVPPFRAPLVPHLSMKALVSWTLILSSIRLLSDHRSTNISGCSTRMEGPQQNGTPLDGHSRYSHTETSKCDRISSWKTLPVGGSNLAQTITFYLIRNFFQVLWNHHRRRL